MWLFLVRAMVVALLAHTGFVYSPFENRLVGFTVGALAAIGVIALELKLRKVPGNHMLGALMGGVTGIVAARLVWGAISDLEVGGAEHFVHVLVVIFLGYMGVVIGGQKAEWFEPARVIAAFRDGSTLQQNKILDTSVIIDGRIVDICETGFLEGTLVVPQFVLRELQQVADSSDSLKRNRGRRGLDILARVQKMSNVHVHIVETDFPEVREVDLKLIELARRISGKIVTNDFNLNKVAQLRGVPVLNINELANSLKPVVLPGEILRVFIIKEGKEAGQGIGYLDDGTMVVVDQARKAMGKTIEVTVTSVLQTTAGKMIFCRWSEPGISDDSAALGRRDSRSNGDRRRPPERRDGERRDSWPPQSQSAVAAAVAAADGTTAPAPRAEAAEPPAVAQPGGPKPD